MQPGFYVVRIPKNSRRNRLIIESRTFKEQFFANNWRDFVQTEHPKDAVFVIKKMERL